MLSITGFNDENNLLLHNNPCFPCNIAITNFLILYTYEIRFYDTIDCTVHTFTSWRHLTQKFQSTAKRVCFGPLIFNLIRFIQLCDKKNLTFVNSWDKILLNSSWKTLLSSPKGLHNNIFQDSFNKISSQLLTHDRSFIFFIKQQYIRIFQGQTIFRQQLKSGSNVTDGLWKGRKHFGKRRKWWLQAFSSKNNLKGLLVLVSPGNCGGKGLSY